MKMLKSLVILCVGLVGSAFADPSVVLDRVQQRYPWNGIVDVDYTVANAQDPTALVVELFATSEAGEKVRAATFLSEPETSDGTHRLSWNATADGAGWISKQTQFRLSLRFVDRATDGDYMIIDLTKGSNASAYKVTFVSDVADPAATFNTDEYKTTKIVLKKIPAGSFWMGATEDDIPWMTNKSAAVSARSEVPRHYVTLTKDFFIGLFRLTWGQYCAVTGDEALKGTAKDNTVLNLQHWRGMHAEDGFFERLNGRVRCLDRSLGQMTVPTETQWEYACRAGTTTPWFFGAEVSKAILQQYAAAWGDSDLTVGRKLPNPWGLYDMYGMMFDTVLDYLPGSKVTYPEGDEEHPVVDPFNRQPSSVGNTQRISRGGASWDDAHCCRSAHRGYINNDTYKTSFRLCFTVEPTPSAE